ncbi:MAG: glycosyltransferase family 4 protein [Bacteroidales bacterium]|nr:glycosyltransferase family 4 protein [Bacteroidales bacterium]
MKIIHINNFDIKGGAAQACFRISESLNEVGISSNMLVQKKFGSSKMVVSIAKSPVGNLLTNIRSNLDTIQMLLFTDRTHGKFSYGNIGVNISRNKLLREADIINFHWINSGLLSLSTIKNIFALKKPIVWTLHDMWAFTGGCHYNGICLGYLESCGNCPALSHPQTEDASNQIWKSKKELYMKANLTIVTCSNWLGIEARKSSLLGPKSIHVIPNSIDTSIFKPGNQKNIRKKLGLSENKLYILFVAMTVKDKRKGFHVLIETLNFIYNQSPQLRDDIEILILGRVEKEEERKIPFKTNSFGRLKAVDTIVNIYNATNVYTSPALQENLSNTILEALACGTPVVAFNIGGMPDMIDHKKSGYLAEPYSIEDYAKGLLWILQNKNITDIKENARKKVISYFSKKIIGTKYKELYNSLLQS